MIKITVAHNVSANAVAKIRALVVEEIRTNPDFNGASYEIERGDYTYLDDESPAGVILFRAIMDTITSAEQFCIDD